MSETFTLRASYVLGGWERKVDEAELVAAVREGTSKSPIGEVLIRRGHQHDDTTWTSDERAERAEATLAAIWLWANQWTPYVEGERTVVNDAMNRVYARAKVHVLALIDAKETPPDGVADIAWNLEKIHALKADLVKSKATLAAIRKWAMEPTGVMLAAKYDVLALLDAKETP